MAIELTKEEFEEFKKGDIVEIVNTINGCHGAKGAIGVITDMEESNGLLGSEMGINVLVTRIISGSAKVNDIWRVNESALIKL